MPSIATKTTSVQPADLEAELTAVDAGVLKDIPVATSLAINGSALTQPQIDAKVKAYLATIEAANTAWQQYQTALVARRNMQLEAHDFFLHLKKAIIAFLGSQNPMLVDFGFTPAKPRAERTAAQNVLTAAKAGLTRKVRGTTSKKQKAAIKPMEGRPAVAVAPDGTTQVSAPTVVNGVVGEPGSSGNGK
jgi:hypothetical protein